MNIIDSQDLQHIGGGTRPASLGFAGFFGIPAPEPYSPPYTPPAPLELM